MSSQIEELRPLIATAIAQKNFPLSLKTQIVAFAHIRRKEGVSVRSIAREMGISQANLSRWLRTSTIENDSNLVQVQITERKNSSPMRVSEPVLISPHGFRVEGLSIQQLCYLLLELR